MKKAIAMLAICAALLSLTACGNQAPLLKQEETTGTVVGVLEDQNDNVLQVRDAQGESRLYWMTGEVTCSAENGETVEITFTGDPGRKDQVLVVREVERA